jgi:thiamine kinase-like enzyme
MLKIETVNKSVSNAAKDGGIKINRFHYLDDRKRANKFVLETDQGTIVSKNLTIPAYKIREKAEALKLCPKAIFYCFSEKIIFTEFIKEKKIPLWENKDQLLKAMIDVQNIDIDLKTNVREIHDPANVNFIIRKMKLTEYPSIERFREFLNLSKDMCSAHKRKVCHGDFLTVNTMQTDDKLLLVDWENAHIGYPFYDLFRLQFYKCDTLVPFAHAFLKSTNQNETLIEHLEACQLMGLFHKTKINHPKFQMISNHLTKKIEDLLK